METPKEKADSLVKKFWKEAKEELNKLENLKQ